MASLMISGDRTILERVAIRARSRMLVGRGGGGGGAAGDVFEPSSLPAVASDDSASSSVLCELGRCLACLCQICVENVGVGGAERKMEGKNKKRIFSKRVLHTTLNKITIYHWIDRCHCIVHIRIQIAIG